MNDYRSGAGRLAPELCALRERFHRTPELGNREFHTAEAIESYLHDLGIPTERVTETAVVGRLTGGRPGPIAALRADMDALPLTEATGAAFASEVPGVMHACGHDVHLAAALGAARLLADRRESLPGSVVFLFQPDEEGDGGAARMIEAGGLDGVDAVFGAHVDPALPLGTVGVKYGKFYAASDMFRITLTGRSCHGAEREKGVDALAAAAALVPALLALPDRMADRSVVNVGTLHAGTAGNIVPGTAELTGILRTLGPDARRSLRSLLNEALVDNARAYGVEPSLALRPSYPGVVNDDGMTDLARAAMTELLGAESVRVLERPLMTTEDFGVFLERVPGTFYHIGAGCPRPLHDPAFLPAAEAVPLAAAVHAAVLTRFLEKESFPGGTASL